MKTLANWWRQVFEAIPDVAPWVVPFYLLGYLPVVTVLIILENGC